MESLLEGLPGDARQQEVATIASLPMQLGGLGIRSTSRMAPSAFWASWADALPMLQDRLPSISNQIADVLDGAQAPGQPHRCLIATVSSTAQGGAHHVRRHLCGCPTGPEFKIFPTLFRTIVCERLCLPLQLTESRCECGAADKCGRHRGACPRSGRLKSRAMAPEKTLARLCREAGGTVRTHVKLRDLNTSVPVVDDRSIEVPRIRSANAPRSTIGSRHHPQINCHVQFWRGRGWTKRTNTTSC